MSSPNQISGTLLAPPRVSTRNRHNVTQSIMIEPTPEYQHFYNINRREMDRQRLERHVAEESNFQSLLQAEPMSGNTASQSFPSPSTVYSHTGDSDASSSLSSDAVADKANSKPPRGRRRGPLDIETRTKTAFKRKFKLTCAYHREKRVLCNCHDFSKLEEGYRRSQVEEQGARAGARSASRHAKFRGSYGEIETLFGTGGGGAAPTTSSYDIDLNEPSNGLQLPMHMQTNLDIIMGFDINSAASVNDLVLAPREQPPFVPSPAPQLIPAEEKPSLVAIGRSTMFRNRWQCEFQSATGTTGSNASADGCAWTGPFEELPHHFKNDHHPFDEPAEPRWSICSLCKRLNPGWLEEPTCQTWPPCPPDSWQKWFFGAKRSQPSWPPRMLTVSEASASAYSGLPDLSWNAETPGSSNTGWSNLPYNTSCDYTGFYEHSASGNEENNEDADDEPKNDMDHESRRGLPRYPHHLNSTKHVHSCFIRNWLSLLQEMMGPGSATCCSNLSLRSLLGLRRHLYHSLLVPFILLHFWIVNFGVKLWDILGAFVGSVNLLQWCLTLVILAGLAAWILTRGLRAGRKEENYRLPGFHDGLHASRQVADNRTSIS